MEDCTTHNKTCSLAYLFRALKIAISQLPRDLRRFIELLDDMLRQVKSSGRCDVIELHYYAACLCISLLREFKLSQDNISALKMSIANHLGIITESKWFTYRLGFRALVEGDPIISSELLQQLMGEFTSKHALVTLM